MPASRTGAAVEAAFWARVDRASADGCWLWTGAKTSDGYVQMRADGRRVVAHRWAYEHFVGSVPKGMELDHLCRVRHCVNPAHLEPVTHRENVLRGVAPSALRAAQTHCSNGHVFDFENTYINAGSRSCRTCHRIRERRRRERNAQHAQ